MLSDLNDQLLTVVVDLDGIKQIGQVVGWNLISRTAPMTVTIVPTF